MASVVSRGYLVTLAYQDILDSVDPLVLAVIADLPATLVTAG